MPTHTCYIAFILVMTANHLACSKSNSAVTTVDESQTTVDAGGVAAEGSTQFDRDDAAPSRLDTDAAHGTVAGPAPPTSAARASRADIVRLRSCCRTFEKLGQGKKNQEGVGLVGLSSVCDDIASSLERGEPSSLNYSDWEEIRPVLDDRSVPASCRSIMLKFEKK